MALIRLANPTANDAPHHPASTDPGAPRPRTFKVENVASGAVLAENVDARTTVDVLTSIDSMFDVSVYVWHPAANAWRRLTVGEHRTLWSFRGR